MEPTVYRPKHRTTKATTQQSRASAAKRGYDRRWRKYRLGYLSTNPWCVVCLKPTKDPVTGEQVPGRHTLATDIDHINEVQGGQNDPLFWESTNHQPLCKRHHSAKTASRRSK